MDENRTNVIDEEEETEMETTSSGNPLGTLLKIGLGVAIGVVGTKVIKKIKDKKAEKNKEVVVEVEDDSDDETEETEE